MKSIFKYMIAVSLVCSLCWSCNDWLTVSPKDSMSEEDMFSTVRGYESVLYGLYRNMAESALYGDFLSFGMINVMSQTYDVSKSERKEFQQAAGYKYTEKEFKDASQQLWETAFNCVANANNLIARLQEAPDDMFNRELNQKELMLGEAHAARAYVHFDLLRLYAPAPVLNDKNKFIPYVDYYPCRFATRMTVDEVLGRIVDDLQEARRYMAWDTTIMGLNAFNNQWDYPKTGAVANNMFYSYRATRFNFYSVTATLARVLWYRNGKEYVDPENMDTFGGKSVSDLDAAVYFANMVRSNALYKYAEESQIMNSLETRETLKMLSELVFALWKEEHSEVIGNYYDSDAKDYALADYTGLYEKSEYREDYRRKYGIYTSPTGGLKLTNRWLPMANLTKEEPIIPMIRLSEMYYLLADAQFYSNKEQAVQELWNARNFRGVYSSLNGNMERDEFVRLLIEDARKEFAGEGKLFFLYKQLNEKVLVSEKEGIVMGGKFTLPVPDSEFVLK